MENGNPACTKETSSFRPCEKERNVTQYPKRQWGWEEQAASEEPGIARCNRWKNTYDLESAWYTFP